MSNYSTTILAILLVGSIYSQITPNPVPAPTVTKCKGDPENFVKVTDLKVTGVIKAGETVTVSATLNFLQTATVESVDYRVWWNFFVI